MSAWRQEYIDWSASSHDADVAAFLGQQSGKGILGDVGVLELVDEDVLVTPLVLLQHVGVVPEQDHGLH